MTEDNAKQIAIDFSFWCRNRHCGDSGWGCIDGLNNGRPTLINDAYDIFLKEHKDRFAVLGKQYPGRNVDLESSKP